MISPFVSYNSLCTCHQEEKKNVILLMHANSCYVTLVQQSLCILCIDGKQHSWLLSYMNSKHSCLLCISQDFAFILKGITRLLNNPLTQTYLPGSCKRIQFYQELLVLFWKMCDINKVCQPDLERIFFVHVCILWITHFPAYIFCFLSFFHIMLIYYR